METVGKQEKTKYKLAASMKECMKQMPVDKITVKKYRRRLRCCKADLLPEFFR